MIDVTDDVDAFMIGMSTSNAPPKIDSGITKLKLNKNEVIF